MALHSQPSTPHSPDVIIIGAGAAGLMCAIEAGKRGRRVVLIEHSEVVGKKIAISGGGRCNFTNLGATPDNYLSANPDFCISALARYTPWDFVALVEKHRIPYHEKKLGQQFCDGSSRASISGSRQTWNAHRPMRPQLFTAATQRFADWNFASSSSPSIPLISKISVVPLLNRTRKSG